MNLKAAAKLRYSRSRSSEERNLIRFYRKDPFNSVPGSKAAETFIYVVQCKEA